MDTPKIFIAVCGLILAVCLVLSVTTLTVLRNATVEQEQVQRQAEALVDNVKGQIERLEKMQPSETDSRPTSAAGNEGKAAFILRDANGLLAVYTEDGYLVLMSERETTHLPATDRERLREGIRRESWQEMLALMQDFGI